MENNELNEPYKHKKDILYKGYGNNKDVLGKYRKISLFSDVIIFVPQLITHIMIAITSVIIYICVDNATGIVFFSIFTFLFIFIYIFCIINVIKYNRFISKSILVEGTVVKPISMRGELRLQSVMVVDVYYQYTDPLGKEHTKKQVVQMFGNLNFDQQLIKWKFLYNMNHKITVLVDENDYDYSYLPMREEYCKCYHKYYSVDLRNFEG